jgi:multiple antibiotic resistance protein
MVSEVVNAFLLVFAGLFPIVNPLGSAPIFLIATRSCTLAERHSLAWRVTVNGFFLLLGSLILGPTILEFFGITLPVVRIAGGIVITTMGWRLLSGAETQADLPGGGGSTPERVTPRDSFYPLTMPLTVGPGSISVAIALGSRRPVFAAGFSQMALLIAGAVAGLIAIAATIFIAYRFASSVARVLGEGGINVLVRLSAFILMCIGIEIIWDGYATLTSPFGH